ncbi:hypothetical protein [Candidatus Methylacidithermus pantelleriae]|nr:hypothetical protein [Candidatus Methylacidithermus pantelleriae]
MRDRARRVSRVPSAIEVSAEIPKMIAEKTADPLKLERALGRGVLLPATP